MGFNTMHRCGLALAILFVAVDCHIVPPQPPARSGARTNSANYNPPMQPVPPMTMQQHPRPQQYHSNPPATAYVASMGPPPTPKTNNTGHLYAVDRRSGQPVPLMPGMLDETLLSRGAFSFDAKRVHFNKLKVLGNVYVNKVNGRPLRESYLFRSNLDGPVGQPTRYVPQQQLQPIVAQTKNNNNHKFWAKRQQTDHGDSASQKLNNTQVDDAKQETSARSSASSYPIRREYDQVHSELEQEHNQEGLAVRVVKPPTLVDNNMVRTEIKLEIIEG